MSREGEEGGREGGREEGREEGREGVSMCRGGGIRGQQGEEC